MLPLGWASSALHAAALEASWTALPACLAAWRGATARQLACNCQDFGEEHVHMLPANISACMTSDTSDS